MVSQHPTVSLGFQANFEKIPEWDLTPLSFSRSGCNFQILKGRHITTNTRLDIILKIPPNFSLCPELGGIFAHVFLTMRSC